MATTKYCSGCQQNLPRDQFYKRNGTAICQSRCKACFANYSKYEKKPHKVDKITEEQKNYVRNGLTYHAPLKLMAKKLNISTTTLAKYIKEGAFNQPTAEAATAEQPTVADVSPATTQETSPRKGYVIARRVVRESSSSSVSSSSSSESSSSSSSDTDTEEAEPPKPKQPIFRSNIILRRTMTRPPNTPKAAEESSETSDTEEE